MLFIILWCVGWVKETLDPSFAKGKSNAYGDKNCTGIASKLVTMPMGSMATARPSQGNKKKTDHKDENKKKIKECGDGRAVTDLTMTARWSSGAHWHRLQTSRLGMMPI